MELFIQDKWYIGKERRDHADGKIFLTIFFLGEIGDWVNSEKLSVSVSGSCLSFQRQTSQREADMCGTLSSLSMINARACSLCFHCRLRLQISGPGDLRTSRIYVKQHASLWKRTVRRQMINWSDEALWNHQSSPANELSPALCDRLCHLFFGLCKNNNPAPSLIFSRLGAAFSLLYWHFRIKEISQDEDGSLRPTWQVISGDISTNECGAVCL